MFSLANLFEQEDLESDVHDKTIKSVTQNRSNMNLMIFNARSCRTISFELRDIIVEKSIDILMLTETWLYEKGDEVLIQEMTPLGYKFHSFPRTTGKKGGGIGIVCKNAISEKTNFFQLSFSSFEAVEARIFNHSTSISIICIYRPPPSKNNNLKAETFRDEFNDLLSSFNNVRRDVLITGDLNIHFDKPNDSIVKQINHLLFECDMKQIVNTSTHKSNHILDAFIVRNNSSFLFEKVEDLALSDHFAVYGKVEFKNPKAEKRCITSRNIKSIDMEKFRLQVKEFVMSCNSEYDIEYLSSFYNLSLNKLLNDYAPLQTRFVPNRKSADWKNEEILKAKQTERKLERQWRDTDLPSQKQAARQLYVNQRNLVKSMTRKAMKESYGEKISKCKNSKQLHTVTNELLGKSKSSPLPNDIPKQSLPNTFIEYFSDKIRKIREDIDISCSNTPEFKKYEGSAMHDFHCVTEEYITELIKSTPCKTCILDPMPTALVKEVEELIPLITKVVNSSLKSGQVPENLKEAIIKPLLKQSGLDQNEMKNYRPVSNLPFISKIIEKVVLDQLQTHLKDNDLLEINQSAYRKNHSTETALLHVLENLLVNADNKLVSILALLDLSAAFDTLDHEILLHRLQITFGIEGKVLQWFSSYLQDRKQSVLIENYKSDPITLQYGVPQGSVLGPTLFTLYTQPLSDIINCYKCDYQKYADDTQLSKSDELSNFSSAVDVVESCIEEIIDWMKCNKLKLNPRKTELIPIASQRNLNDLDINMASVDGHNIMFSSGAKDLGVYIDNTLSMQKHISTVCKSAYYELRRISQIKSYLPLHCIEQLVCCFVLSRLDYCNSTLAGLPSKSLEKLQKVQNNAARLILRKSKREHVTPLLYQLHWLPIEVRIDFKLAVFGYRFFEDSLPTYLSRTLQSYRPGRCLRSSSESLLVQPKRNTKTFGERSFSFQIPKVWNKLPMSLKRSSSLAVFKKELKTYLFKQYFC